MIKEAFLYVWTDTMFNKLYVGIHKGTTDDGYVCSGKLMLEQYNERPEYFSRQIIAKGLYKDMAFLECAILKSANAAKDLDFYNQHNGDGNFYCKGHTLETRLKLKNNQINYKRTEEHKKAISIAKKGKIPKCVFTRQSFKGENNPNFGKSNKNIHETTFCLEGNTFKGAEAASKFFNIDRQEVYRRVCSKIEKWKDWNVLGKTKDYIKKQAIKRPDLTKRNLENNPAKTDKARALISAKNKGKTKPPRSDFTKQKMSESKKIYWMNRKENLVH